MLDGLSETTLLRIAIGVAALVLFAVILFTSRKSSGQQGKRHAAGRADASGGSRQEPTLRDLLEADAGTGDESAAIEQSELDLLEKTLAGEDVARPPARPPRRCPVRVPTRTSTRSSASSSPPVPARRCTVPTWSWPRRRPAWSTAT